MAPGNDTKYQIKVAGYVDLRSHDVSTHDHEYPCLPCPFLFEWETLCLLLLFLLSFAEELASTSGQSIFSKFNFTTKAEPSHRQQNINKQKKERNK